MLSSSNLVHLIERNATELTESWIRVITQHPATPTYARYDRAELFDRAYRVYSELGRWISRATTRQDIEKRYTALGEMRCREGFALSEVIQALVVIRRVLWFKVQSDGLLDTALDLNMALALYNRVLLFFDRAIYFTSLGYEKAQARELSMQQQ